jgi:hypothetical protein
MKKKLFILLSVFMLSTLATTVTYAQELNAKELKAKAKAEEKAAKEAAKAAEKARKDSIKNVKLGDLRQQYEEYLATWEPIDTNVGVAEVDTFFKHTNELFARMVGVERNIGFIQMVPEPYFDEEMGVQDTTWNAVNKQTGEPIKRSDALKTYVGAGLDLTLCATQAALVATESASALLALVNDPLKAFSLGKRVKQAGKSITMTTKVIPLIQRNIKENTEKLKYKRINQADGDVIDEPDSTAVSE